MGIFFQDWAPYLTPIGEMFIRLLRMIIVPLVFASLVTAIVGLGTLKSLGRLGWKTIIYCVSTTGVAACVGLLISHFFLL